MMSEIREHDRVALTKTLFPHADVEEITGLGARIASDCLDRDDLLDAGEVGRVPGVEQLRFAQPVRSPIALGFACHFGLGACVPIPP